MFDGRFLANLLVTTFAQPVCEAEEITPYDQEMAELIARGGHPLSDYMPPSVREEFNHTMTLEKQMLPLVVVSVGLLVAYGLSRAVDYCQNRKILITSPVFNADNGKKDPNDGPAVLKSSRLQ